MYTLILCYIFVSFPMCTHNLHRFIHVSVWSFCAMLMHVIQVLIMHSCKSYDCTFTLNHFIDSPEEFTRNSLISINSAVATRLTFHILIKLLFCRWNTCYCPIGNSRTDTLSPSEPVVPGCRAKRRRSQHSLQCSIIFTLAKEFWLGGGACIGHPKWICRGLPQSCHYQIR